MRRRREQAPVTEQIPVIASGEELLEAELMCISEYASELAATMPLAAADAHFSRTFSGYDTGNQLHVQSRQDGFAHGLTRRAVSDIMGSEEKRLLAEWRPRSEKIFDAACYHLLDGYFETSIANRAARKRTMGLFLDLSKDSGLPRQTQNELKRTQYETLINRTLNERKGTEQAIVMDQLRSIARDHLDFEIVLSVEKEPPIQPAAETIQLLPDVPKLDLVPTTKPERQSRHTGTVYKAALVASVTTGTLVPTLSTPAVAAESAHVSTVLRPDSTSPGIELGSPFKLAMPTSGLNAPPSTINVGDVPSSLQTETYPQSASVAAEPIRLDTAAPTSLITSAPNLDVSLGKSKNPVISAELSHPVSLLGSAEIQPLATPKMTTSEIMRLAGTSRSDFQIALVKHMTDKGEQQAAPEANSVLSIVLERMDDIARRSDPNDAVINKRLTAVYMLALFPHSQKAFASDPLLAALMTDAFGNAQGDFSIDAYTKAASYRTNLIDSRPSDLNNYSQTMIDGISKGLSIAASRIDQDAQGGVGDLTSNSNSGTLDIAFGGSAQGSPHHHQSHHHKQHHAEQPKHHAHHETAHNAGRYDKILTLVSRFEGGHNYNAYYGHGDNTSIDFTSMSVGEVMAWQRRYLARGSQSSAMGRYQFLLKTLESEVHQHNIPYHTKFDKHLQDRLAVHLLEKRNLGGYLRGDISAAEFAHNLSMEWASLPRVIGSHPESSYYSGDGLNHSFISVHELMDAVHAIKSHGHHKAGGRQPHARHHGSGHHEGTRVPEDPNARAGYFANKLGINRSDIDIGKSSAGILHFVVKESGWRKLGIKYLGGYPRGLQSADHVVDANGMFSGECVSYAGWRVEHDGFGRDVPYWGGHGDAQYWDNNARAAGIKVNDTLQKGSVIVWNTNGPEHTSAGHVAYVEKAFPDEDWAVYSQMNYDGNSGWNVEILSPQNLHMLRNQINIIHFEGNKHTRHTSEHMHKLRNKNQNKPAHVESVSHKKDKHQPSGPLVTDTPISIDTTDVPTATLAQPAALPSADESTTPPSTDLIQQPDTSDASVQGNGNHYGQDDHGSKGGLIGLGQKALGRLFG